MKPAHKEDYDPMIDGLDLKAEAFDELLIEVLEQRSMTELIKVPGVYEALVEEYNNDVLELWANRTEEAK